MVSGWSNFGLLTIMGLFAIMNVAMRGNLLKDAISFCFGNGKHPRLDRLRQLLICSAVSAFMNNTPLVSLIVPVRILCAFFFLSAFSSGEQGMGAQAECRSLDILNAARICCLLRRSFHSR